MWLVILILLVLLVVGLPHWPYTRPLGYGYWPSGVLFILLIIILILILTNHAHWGFGPYPPP
jgi:hypothetical protein